MAAIEGDAAARPRPLRDALATVVDAVATRVELATVELDEQRAQWARQARYAAAATFCGALAAVLFVALAVFAAPAEQRVAVLAALAIGALAGAGLCAWRLRALNRTGAPLFSATLDVLRADAAALRPRRHD